MFDQTFVDGVGKTNKGWTVLISALIQFAILAVLIVIPLVFYSEIGQTTLTSMLVAPAPPPPPPPPPPPAQVIKVVKVAPRQFDTTLHAPKTIPKQVAVIVEAELPPAVGDVQPVGVVGGFGPSTGVPGGVLGGIPPPPKVERLLLRLLRSLSLRRVRSASVRVLSRGIYLIKLSRTIQLLRNQRERRVRFA